MAQCSIKCLEVFERTPGRHRVTRYMHQQATRGVEQGALVDYIKHHDLLKRAPKQAQALGHH
ncbi:hypothetical protein D3C81_795190 [compost metagenome]